jgi:dihydroorotase-like cyclic amidohydrolase
MKRTAMLSLIASFVLLGATTILSQEKSIITVKGSELNNGVVIVDVVKDGKGYDLQCNEGSGRCTALKGGKYLMVEMPKNTGMYECRDVQIYADGVDPAAGKQVGEYCLVDK